MVTMRGTRLIGENWQLDATEALANFRISSLAAVQGSFKDRPRLHRRP